MYKQIQEPYTKLTLIQNYQKILIAMTPIVPHFSSECLDLLGIKKTKWPRYDESILKENITNIVVQINGKKRGLIKTKIDINEEKLFEIIKNDETLSKYLNQKNLKKKIYIKNKLMNIII
jgi:leucyl-tRNA synthetase